MTWIIKFKKLVSLNGHLQLLMLDNVSGKIYCRNFRVYSLNSIKLYKLPEAWDGESEQVIFGFSFGSDSLGK